MTVCFSIFSTKKKRKKLSPRLEPKSVVCPEEGRKERGGPCGTGGERSRELRSVRKQEAVFTLPSLPGWLRTLPGSSAFCLKCRPQGKLPSGV